MVVFRGAFAAVVTCSRWSSRKCSSQDLGWKQTGSKKGGWANKLNPPSPIRSRTVLERSSSCVAANLAAPEVSRAVRVGVQGNLRSALHSPHVRCECEGERRSAGVVAVFLFSLEEKKRWRWYNSSVVFIWSLLLALLKLCSDIHGPFFPPMRARNKTWTSTRMRIFCRLSVHGSRSTFLRSRNRRCSATDDFVGARRGNRGRARGAHPNISHLQLYGVYLALFSFGDPPPESAVQLVLFFKTS